MYSSFDYLCNEPFYINGIGNINPPTLRDIRKISYNLFQYFLALISSSKEECSTILEIEDEYNSLGDAEREKLTTYLLLLYKKPQFLFSLVSFFINDSFEFDENNLSFKIYQVIGEEKEYIGEISNDNFEVFCEELQRILGLKNNEEEKEQKFKNETARKLFEKIKKHAKEQKKKQDENYTIDNMILKYCTHNKVGINILNVWDMTYYQFTTLFSEYCNGRQCDFNDMMAANTFSYKKSTDYKPLDYIKKLNNN